ncbi:MAG: hypothetical protein NTW86_23915 [Candidatus Sumerlaeota bacterium]|nr:hypothetical protein [Candidatus Sumerlaeota bacterium]
MTVPFSHWVKRLRGADAEAAQRRLARYEAHLAAYERRVRRMRRRWPALGEAADHPLTAVFAIRRSKTRLGGCAVAILAYILVSIVQTVVFGVGLASGSVQTGIFWLLASGILVLAAPFLYSAWSKRRPSVELDRLFAPGNKDLLLNLWLAPLSYRRLLAMEAARIWLRQRLRTRILAAALLGLIGWLIFLSMRLGETLPQHYGEGLVFFGGAAAFLLSFLGVCDDLLLRGALLRLHSTLRDVRQFKTSLAVYIGKAVAIVALVAALIVFLIAGVAAQSFSLSFIAEGVLAVCRWIAAEPYGRLGLYLLAFAGAITAFSRTVLPRITDARFVRLAKGGESAYMSYAQMLSEET